LLFYLDYATLIDAFYAAAVYAAITLDATYISAIVAASHTPHFRQERLRFFTPSYFFANLRFFMAPATLYAYVITHCHYYYVYAIIISHATRDYTLLLIASRHDVDTMPLRHYVILRYAITAIITIFFRRHCRHATTL